MGEGTGYVAAVVLGALFLRAAAAKLARRDDAARAFAALRVPAPAALARGVPIVELVLAAALLAGPRAGAGGSLVVLAAFSAVLLRAVRSGVTAPCACFGAATADPVSYVDLLRNALLAVLGGTALAASRPALPRPAAVAAVAAGVAVGYAAVASARRRQRRT